MDRSDYWRECIEIAAEECGAALTKEQIDAIAGSVEGAHENFGMAFHRPESPYIKEVADLREALKREQRKEVCTKCRGRGSITTVFGPIGRSSTETCWVCNGEGKVLP